MNRKITEVALAGMCTGLGARGSPTPARACSRCKIEARARPPMPPKASRTNSRRVRVGREWGRASPYIKESIEVEDRQGELLQGLIAEEVERGFPLGRRRRSAEAQPERPVDRAGEVAPRFLP